MKKSILLLSAILVFGLLATGCALKLKPAETQKVILDADDAGRQVEIAKGQTLEITLEGNPTTGYMWEVEELDERILIKVGEPEFKPQSDAIGAPGVLTLRFAAAGAGQTTLKLIYHRSWEKGVKPLKTFTVSVAVR